MNDRRKEKLGDYYSGALIVCPDGRLEPTGDFACLKKKDAGTAVAVKLQERAAAPNYWADATPGYWAEIVISPPDHHYKGPPPLCRLPEQFDRFERPKPEPDEDNTSEPARGSGNGD